VIRGAVLGSPITHSLSPLLHTTAYEFLGIEASYFAFDVKSGGLAHFLSENDELNCLSLTMPLKEQAFDLADSVSAIAAQISSGNTLHRNNGQWQLTSTDVDGFVSSCHANNASLAGSVLVIGGGATARAVIGACNGISQVIHVINRNSDREKSIRSAAPLSEIIFHSWQVNELINSVDLVVNTTPAGVGDFFRSSINQPTGVFFEVLYNPWPTQLLQNWREQGGNSVDGLELLIHQGISQIEIFSGSTVDRSSLAKLLRLKALEVLEASTP
jgi:shikimate dehydrogenase